MAFRSSLGVVFAHATAAQAPAAANHTLIDPLRMAAFYNDSSGK
jgi:hypothetical protein